MVAFVMVSHSDKLAQGVIHLTKMSAPDAVTAAAGGLENGEYGTDFEKIMSAVESVYSEDGVIVLTDMGSAVMTAQMVAEALIYPRLKVTECPMIAGAVTGTVLAVAGADFDEIVEALEEL